MTNDQIILEVCIDVFQCNKDDIIIDKRLMGGMSNYTYIVAIKGQKYTFRIPGKKAEMYVDRTVEKYHIEMVESLDLNSEVVYLDLEKGYKIAHYIEGTPLNELNPTDYLEEVSNVLHKLHSSGMKSKYPYNPLERLAKYESYTFEFGFQHSERYQSLKAKLLGYASTLIQPSEYVFTHGDCQASNFVKTPDGIKLMDWEFSGNNDPLYDIACFGDFVYEYALKLLPVYLGKEPSVLEWNKVYFYMAFQALQWHNVAMYKEFIGLSIDLGFDFVKIADDYLDDATLFLNSIK